MKKVLFIGTTKYDFKKHSLDHLEEKFSGLSKGIKPFVLAKGRPFHSKKWGASFYLLPSTLLLWPIFLLMGFYICISKDIDVIIAQSPLVEGFTGSIIKFFLKKELIVEMHGDWELGPFLSRKSTFEPLQKMFVPFLANVSFKSADKLRGVADYLIEKARKIAGFRKTYKFHTFTDLSLFLKEKDLESRNFILFVGYLEQVKGVRYLIEAFSKTTSRFSDFKLIIIGDGSEKQRLMDLSSKLGLNDRIEFKGRLSLERTKDIMRQCYLFVLPSLSEGLPRVILEAMSLGKPVLASRVGGIPELIKDNENGFLFEKQNPADLASKLKILLSDRELVKRMGENNRKIAGSRFSDESYINNYISMIND